MLNLAAGMVRRLFVAANATRMKPSLLGWVRFLISGFLRLFIKTHLLVPIALPGRKHFVARALAPTVVGMVRLHFVLDLAAVMRYQRPRPLVRPAVPHA